MSNESNEIKIGFLVGTLDQAGRYEILDAYFDRFPDERKFWKRYLSSRAADVLIQSKAEDLHLESSLEQRRESRDQL